MNNLPGRKPSVLLVEDDRSIATAFSRYRRACGYATEVAENSAAALQVLGGMTPDVIVTDIFMKGGDGFELIKAVTASHSDLPIIAVSGGRDGYDVLAHAAKLGASATMEKPFGGDHLVAAIDSCLAARELVPLHRGFDGLNFGSA